MEEGAGKAFSGKEEVFRSAGARFPDFGKRQRCEFAGTRLPENVSKELEQRFPDFGRAGKRKSELRQDFQNLEEGSVSSFVGARFPDFGKGRYFQHSRGLTLKI